MGYVSKTYSSIVGGGEPEPTIEFRKLVTDPAIKKYKPKIIVGGFGSGSWNANMSPIAMALIAS